MTVATPERRPAPARARAPAATTSTITASTARFAFVQRQPLKRRSIIWPTQRPQFRQIAASAREHGIEAQHAAAADDETRHAEHGDLFEARETAPRRAPGSRRAWLSGLAGWPAPRAARPTPTSTARIAKTIGEEMDRVVDDAADETRAEHQREDVHFAEDEMNGRVGADNSQTQASAAPSSSGRIEPNTSSSSTTTAIDSMVPKVAISCLARIAAALACWMAPEPTISTGEFVAPLAASRARARRASRAPGSRKQTDGP